MEENYTIQLRGLNEAVYCEKLFHLMYAQGLFLENAETVEGKMHHIKRENIKRNHLLEGVNVFSEILYGMDGKLSGKLDGVIEEGGEYIPIEDKNSKNPGHEYECILWGVPLKTSIWINDFPQIVGQMYLLRKNNYTCNKGRVYYRGSNKTIEIEYDEKYDKLIENGVEHCIDILKNSEPAPLIDSDKCVRCSLNWACLPDEINSINSKSEEPRRLYPGRPDTSILYVASIGSKIGKTGESLVVWTPDGEKSIVPIKDVQDVCIYGNVQITTQAQNEIIKNGGSIFYFTGAGWLKYMTSAPITKNIYLRIAQFKQFEIESFCIGLIKNLVSAKVSNQRTLTRRNRKSDDADKVLKELMNIKNKIDKSDDVEIIRGYEGSAARIYWDYYPSMILNHEDWKMEGRNRRPPRDEINAMLSYGYSLLLRDFISAIIENGMDYLYGFYHVIVPGRPAFALDMMEPYRPIIVDSLVLRLINEGIIQKSNFQKTEAGVFMNPEGKRKLIYMYEKRLDEMITHPSFGYRLSYRRMIHLEVKLLGKYILGEIGNYVPLMTR